ncbi:MAG: PAS domain-containing protein, partial [Deltaproteobacteria bacterium]|nr:PAS domain-containing protein [Deltaproteobacteria bacterium]
MTGRSPRPRSAREQDPELAEISSKIKWLMFFRVVMISVLLGTTMVFNLEELAKLQDPLQLYIIVLILFVYVLTLLYALLLPHLRRLRLFAHVQLTTDVLLSAALVWVTGGTASAFTFIFSLAIVNGATILYRTGALVTATTSAFAFVGLALLEGFTGVGRPPGWSGQLAEEAGGRNLYFLCYVHVASFYLIAVLSSYLSEMLRKADRRIRAQAEDIERMRALNEQIVGSITSGMMISTAGRISFFNRSAERITGLNGAEVLGRPVHELFDGLLLPGGSPPDEAADEPRTEQRTPTPPPVRTRTEDRWQLEFRRPDGESILLGYRVGPLQGQKGQGDGLILFED